jgi:C-terminal processing protease CtpA/Prc
MKIFSIVAVFLFACGSIAAQSSLTDGEEFLLISGKKWPRWELERWHPAYKTTGIILGRSKENIFIEGVANGSPGEDAGLKAGDLILMVGTKQATGMTLGDIDQAMLGNPGKTVDFVIGSPGETTQRKIILTLKAVTFEELKKRELSQNNNINKG